jgi:hypothetical protein
MNKLINLLVLIVTVAVFLPSCKDDEKTYNYSLNPANVQVSTAALNFGVNELVPQTLPVTATEGGRYWISSKPGWATATLNGGGQTFVTGSSTLSVSVSPNDGLVEREGEITISTEAAGGKIEVAAKIPVKQGIASVGATTGWTLNKTASALPYAIDKDSILVTAPAKTKFAAKFVTIEEKDGEKSTVADDRFEVLKGKTADTASFYIVFKQAAENRGNEPIKTSLMIQKNDEKAADNKLVFAVIEVVQAPLPAGGITGWTIPQSVDWAATPDSVEKTISIEAPAAQNVHFELVGADKKFEIASKLEPLYAPNGDILIKEGELAVTTAATELKLRNLVENSEVAVEAYLIILNKDNKAVGKVKLTIAKKP